MKVFISGGCKNGKSFYAQRIAKQLSDKNNQQLYYIATMIATDDEDRKRINKHILDRQGWDFITIEQGRDIYNCSKITGHEAVYLLDSTTALLANEMFLPDMKINHDADKKIISDLQVLINEVDNIVFVSDFIYSDAALYDELTEKYRQNLANIDRFLASVCDSVIEVCSSNIKMWKGNQVV